MTWRIVRHPLVATDLFSMARHIAEFSGSETAAERRIVEAEETLTTIADNPMSGTRLDGRLSRFRRRQSSRDGKITVVFGPDPERELVYVHLVSFGGRDWQREATRR